MLPAFRPTARLTETGRLPAGRALWVVAGVLLLLYLGLVRLRPPEVFWSLDEGGKYIYLHNVLALGDPRAPLAYPGQAIDHNLDFVPLYFFQRVDDQIFSWWPVGFLLATVPLYALLGWIGLYVLPALGGSIIAYCTGWLVHELTQGDRRAALLAAGVVGLATPVAFYSTLFWEHTPAVACVLVALTLAAASKTTGHRDRLFVAGILAALAVFLRTEQLAFAVAIVAIGILRYDRRGWWLVSGFVLGVGAGAVGNYLLMGNPLSRQWGRSGESLVQGLFGGVREAGVWYIPQMLFNSDHIIAFDLGPIGLVVGTILVALAVALPLMRSSPALLVAGYTGLAVLCAWVLFQPYGYRSVHGFVLVAPHVVLAIWWPAIRNNSARRPVTEMMTLGATLFLILYVARSWVAAGGQQWGPRYMLTLYPYCVTAASVGLSRLWRGQPGHWRRGLVIACLALVLVGLGFNGRGQSAITQTVTRYADTQAALAAQPDLPRLTDCTWIAMVIPSLYWEGQIFAQTSRSLTEWKTLLVEHHVPQSQYLRLDLCGETGLDTIAAERSVNPSGLTLTPIPLP